MANRNNNELKTIKVYAKDHKQLTSLKLDNDHKMLADSVSMLFKERRKNKC